MQNEVGNRVEIIRTDIFSLKHRKRPWFGFITGIDGSYINVRPTHCKWIIELYPNEIKHAQLSFNHLRHRETPKATGDLVFR